MRGRSIPAHPDDAFKLWILKVTGGKHVHDHHEDTDEIIDALDERDAEEIMRAGLPRYDNRFCASANEILLGLRCYAFNRTACWDTFCASVDQLATRESWSPEDGRELAKYIVNKRLNGFMPTVAEIKKAAVELFREAHTLDTLMGVLDNCNPDKDEIPRSLAEALIYHAYEAGARSGMSQEQLEILGKFLIKKSKEAGQ